MWGGDISQESFFFFKYMEFKKENGPDIKTNIIESNIKRTQSKIKLQK